MKILWAYYMVKLETTIYEISTLAIIENETLHN